jgi:type-F conjugative transfer system pilin assembly protein TrbC
MKKALFPFYFLLIFEVFAEEVSYSDISLADKELAENELQKAQETVAQIEDQLKHSSEHVEFAKQISEHQKVNLEDFHKVAKEVEYLTGALPATGAGCENCRSTIQNIQNKEADVENGIIVFVSFSMPKASLVELSDHSGKYGATLVLRGIHEDSFLKTKDKIMEINPNGLHMDINPQLFKDYKVLRVPTFVLVRNGREINRLSGNVTLEYAVSKFKEVQ